jgi:hypothetical protein
MLPATLPVSTLRTTTTLARPHGYPAPSVAQAGAGVTNRTWTVTMPATPGQYEFRFFLNDGYQRSATSPPVIVGN